MKLSLQVRYSLAVVCILAAIVGFMGIAHLYGFRSLISASTLATAKTVSDALYKEERKQSEDLAGFLARILVDPVSRSRAQAIDGLIIAALAQPGMVYVVVHDAQGRVIGGAGAGSKPVPKWAARAGAGLREKAGGLPLAQIAQALSTGKIVSQVDGLALLITAPIIGSRRPLGTVTLGTSLQATKTDVAKFGGYMDAVAAASFQFFSMIYVGIAVMIVVIGLGIGIIMVRDMARPFQALGHYMRRIGTGKYDEPPPFERSDELGDLARELGRMAQNLKKVAEISRLAILGELAVGVAHELNQPLNTIRLAADNVLLSRRSEGSDSDFAESKLRLISEQAANMGDLIQRMCVVGRAEGGRTKIDARESVRDAVSLLANRCEDEGIEMSIDLPDDVALVLGRRNELAQVLINLIVNARDAVLEAALARGGPSDAGGGHIWIRMETRPQEVIIEVADNGGGIGPDLVERIFDPFFTTKEATKGTGLGLSISLGIVHAMGGRLGTANKGGGAVFTVQLPRADGAA
ncbi:MAG: HAMP domain-containing protein [Proteobacteria bacterium]|nr:HAMP domain-containing protein [Pseudomonadota bacterium]